MKNIVKIFGLMSIIAVIPGAMAATARVSMVSKASPRLPSIAGYIASKNVVTTTGGVSYLADPDCLSNYTDCIKGNEACGSGFEECTTNTLLHAKMPLCLNILAQCSAGGVKSLFGTNSLSAITTATVDSTGEITGYTYPTSDSALGQMVTAAQIANQLTKDQCVKKYTACLKKDAVCGADFELCTDNTEFKKQALACESTLARCKNDGKEELFGKASLASSLTPAAGSRLDEMIKEGEALAVNNAVATCNKVTDQCILNACSKNPNKCIEGRPELLIRISDAANGGKAITTQDLMEISKITTKRDITSYISQECKQTIGSNRYCYMTVKKMPVTKESVLTNPDNVDDVFDDMYQGEFGRFAALKTKIDQIVDKYDAKIQDKCIDTMSSCAMRSCGGGVGSVCYTQSRNGDGSVSITKTPKSYKEIKSACRAIVDTDANCQYAAVLNTSGLYGDYLSEESNVFTTLFPDGAATDPIGIVAYLNSLLATSYNDAAIESLRKQCQATALGCVKSMCGKEYVNCYRNRTDIVAGTYATGDAKFDRSMNKVGGVLDYNIVIGLCLNTIKNSSVCEEHLKIAANANARDTDKLDKQSWFYDTGEKDDAGNAKMNEYGSVREGWLGSNSTKVQSKFTDKVVVGCRITEDEANSKDNCVAYATMDDVNGSCEGVMDEDGCLYSEPVYQGMTEYVLDNAGKTLFQELLVDVEKEVQAKYNAKLTKEQNACLANNNGGIQGASDNGSTFMWVKLRSNKIPKNYVMKGLEANQFSASNDLYGSFCRAKITVTSDDPAVQKVLSDDKYSRAATAYFAVGDSFTCGSWLSDKTLEEITKKVAENAVKQQGMEKGSAKSNAALAWGTVAPFVVGGVAGYLGMDAIQKKGGTLGGLVGDNTGKEATEYYDKCEENVRKAANEFAEAQRYVGYGENATALTHYNNAVRYANIAKQNAANAGQTELPTFGGATYTPGVTGSAGVYAWGSAREEARAAVIDALEVVESYKDNEACSYSSAKSAFQNIKNALDVAPVDADAGESLKSSYDKAKLLCGIGSFWVFPKVSVTVVQDAVKGSNGTSLSADNNYKAFESNLGQLESKCAEIKTNGNKDSRRNANLIASAVTSVAAGALGFGIAKTALDVKRENIGNEAVSNWMQEIGEHIQCYLGTDELGSFGDVISIDVQ